MNRRRLILLIVLGLAVAAFFFAGEIASKPDRPTRDKIFHAVYIGDLAALQRFVEQGADINIKDNMGDSLMHIATRGGHLEVMKRLKEQGDRKSVV